MSQMIYNITTAVSEEIRDSWLQWMREVQIPRVLNTRLFTSARLLRVHAFEKDALTFSVQYLCESREHFEKFKEDYAPEIDAAYHETFGEAATNFATVLEVLSAYERGDA